MVRLGLEVRSWGAAFSGSVRVRVCPSTEGAWRLEGTLRIFGRESESMMTELKTKHD